MKILITGGLGFIGINTVKFFSKENEVHIIDNITRKGNIENYNQVKHLPNVFLHVKDIRNFFDIKETIKKIVPDVIIHLAGQVAVTVSITNPREDFEINMIGTFNILESIREVCSNSILIYSSTNKVYGDYKKQIIELEKKYEYLDSDGVDENTLLDFHSPYGCSKGGADQYVRDYSRIYNLKTVVLRQSCIYGENQYGIEDQGWVAWFTIASFFDKPFTIFGNGKQVRDILHIHDLVILYKKIIENIDVCSGNIFNVGGGKKNSLSLIELIEYLEILLKRKIKFDYSKQRPGDQNIYISNISKLNNLIGWSPTISPKEGIVSLFEWSKQNEQILKSLKII